MKTDKIHQNVPQGYFGVRGRIISLFLNFFSLYLHILH